MTEERSQHSEPVNPPVTHGRQEGGMSAVDLHSSARIREIRAYLAEDAAIDDMPRTHPSSPTPMLRDLLVEYDSLVEQLEALVTLVRVGFLVTVNGEKGRTDVVNDPELRKLLFTILQAKDTAAAISAVASSPASTPEAREGGETTYSRDQDVRLLEDALAAGKDVCARVSEGPYSNEWLDALAALDRIVAGSRSLEERVEALERELAAAERFEDDVRDVMDFMEDARHHRAALNAALARLNDIKAEAPTDAEANTIDSESTGDAGASAQKGVAHGD